MSKESAAGTSGFEPPKYLASLIDAVNDGAKAAQGGAFLFLLVGLYLLATAFGASDEDLLLGRTVTITQIGAALPVSFSFAIAPLVFVFLHIYTLVRYDMLAANVRQFRRELQDTVEEEANRERCRQLLANVEFVGALTTPRRSALYSRLWSWLFIGIVAMFPVAVLLLVQINALRYQSELITNVQRVWLALDLAALVWFFARDPLHGSGAERVRIWRRMVRWGGLLIGLPAFLIGLDFYWFSTVPAEADPKLVHYNPNATPSLTDTVPSLTDTVHQPLDVLLCPRLNWGCRFLRVEHRSLVEKVWDDKAMAELRAGGTEPTKALAGIEGVVLRGRSLRFVVLNESRLYAADLIGADLRRASLVSASLPGARLQSTHLQGANLYNAQLQGTDLHYAQLQGANLLGAQLQGADLANTQLQGADLYYAHLQGADLYFAQLQGTDLTIAYLQGANLYNAQLQGADLRQARLWRTTSVSQGSANLALADVRGADFHTPPTKEEQARLRQNLATIPESDRRHVAERWLQVVLALEGPAPPFRFTASHSQPMLAGDPPDPALTAHPDWLISTPTPAYTAALADYLAGELAPLNPTIAAGIARRVADGLSDDAVRPIAVAIACRLLANRELGLKQNFIDQFALTLKHGQLPCPTAPAAASQIK